MDRNDILHTIVAYKRVEVARQEASEPLAALEARIAEASPCRSMKHSLESSRYGIIAEFKRRSPSEGWINRDADAAAISAGYTQAGASAVSILTDEHFFGGSLADMEAARKATDLPLLRKDFVTNAYHLFQARAYGADAVLLIASVLSPGETRELSVTAHALGLEVLLEIHSEAELGHLNPHVDMVGVNNRNLGTFITDTDNSMRLADKLPDICLKVSESGISSACTLRNLRNAGFRGFLVGSAFMKCADPAAALSELVESLKP